MAFKIALLFGFMGYLRVSNLAPNTITDFDKLRHTTWGDIWPSNYGIIFSLKWSKTRQCATNTVSIPLPALGESELCPLRAWREYSSRLTGVDITPETPILLSMVHPIGKPITVPVIREFMRRAAEAVGLSAQAYTPHSLRRGGASFSFNMGVPLEFIKFHGTWESNAVNAYLTGQPRFNTPVARAFVDILALLSPGF